MALSSMLLYCESATYPVKSPIRMCAKSDYSLCVDVPFPNGCVNLNTVNMTSTGQRYIDLSRTVQSVVVIDVESNEEKCIVLYDAFYCQGNSLVLKGNVHPAVNLHIFGFANRAVSFRQCSARVYNQMNNNPSKNDRITGNEIVENWVELNVAESNNVESNHAEPNEAMQNEPESNEAMPNEAELNKAMPNEVESNEAMPNEVESNEAIPNELLPWPIQRDNELKGAESLAEDESNDQIDFVSVV